MLIMLSIERLSPIDWAALITAGAEIAAVGAAPPMPTPALNTISPPLLVMLELITPEIVAIASVLNSRDVFDAVRKTTPVLLLTQNRYTLPCRADYIITAD
jgi:hypothetical protein